MSYKEEFKVKYEEFKAAHELVRGLESVSIDTLLDAFRAFAPELPVTKAMLGRQLSKEFLKKQHWLSDDQLTQHYYLSKSF